MIIKDRFYFRESDIAKQINAKIFCKNNLLNLDILQSNNYNFVKMLRKRVSTFNMAK